MRHHGSLGRLHADEAFALPFGVDVMSVFARQRGDMRKTPFLQMDVPISLQDLQVSHMTYVCLT